MKTLSDVDVPAWRMQPFLDRAVGGPVGGAGHLPRDRALLGSWKRFQEMDLNARVWPHVIPDRPDLETSISTKSVNLGADPQFSERWYILEEVYRAGSAEVRRSRAELDRPAGDLQERAGSHL